MMLCHFVVRAVLYIILSSSVTCLIVSYHLVLRGLMESRHTIRWPTHTHINTFTHTHTRSHTLTHALFLSVSRTHTHYLSHSHSNTCYHTFENLQERHWRISCGPKSHPSQTSRSATLSLSLWLYSLFWMPSICLHVWFLSLSWSSVLIRQLLTHSTNQLVYKSVTQTLSHSFSPILIIRHLYECVTRRQATGCGQRRWKERELRYVTHSTVQHSIVFVALYATRFQRPIMHYFFFTSTSISTSILSH